MKRRGCWGVVGLVLTHTACTVVTESRTDQRSSDETQRRDLDASNGSDSTGESVSEGTSAPIVADAGVVTDADGASDSGVIGTEREAAATSDVLDGDAATDPAVTDCAELDLSAATAVSGTLRNDVTWSGQILVKGEVRVSGARVIIEPGTHVVFDVDSSLSFGWNNNAVTLFADGNEDSPVRFCGKTPGAGGWGFVEIGARATSDSRLRHVVIEGAGSGGAAALVLKSPVLLDDVRVSDVANVGVTATNFAAESRKLMVNKAGLHAVTLVEPAAVHRFPIESELTGNSDDSVHVAFTTINDAVTFRNLGVPYVQEGTALQARGGANVRFEAGVEYVFTADSRVEFGWNNGDVTLNVAGTATEPVIFRGSEESPGHWSGVTIRPRVRTNSAIHHLSLAHAGGDDNPALLVQSAITISDLTLQDNRTGARIDAQGLSDGSARWMATGTQSEPLTILPDAWTTVPLDSDFSGNGVDRISVLQGSYNRVGTVPNPGVPYWIRGEVRTTGNTEMTIAPGTHFVFASDARLSVGWNGAGASLLAEGTEIEPIRFTGESETPGFWYGLELGANVRSSSALRWVEIRHAGGGPSPAAALVLRTGISVIHTTISDSQTWGILRRTTDVNDYSESNRFADNAAGDIGEF